MTVTIRELARLANTSVATISRVVNNKDGVSAERRESITELAERLGYQPNQFARSLVKQKSHLLGFIAASLMNVDYVEVFRIIEAECRNLGYQALIADSMLDKTREKGNIETMMQNQAEGLIILPVSDHSAYVDIEHLLHLKIRKLPFVVIGKLEAKILIMWLLRSGNPPDV